MRDERSAAESRPHRLLVRGVNWLGDAIMTLPALQRLRERFPDSYVTLLTHQKLGDLWNVCRSVDSILTFAPDESCWSIGRRLRAGRFDTALVLPNSPRSALEVWWAGIPQRLGYARPWRSWLLTEAIGARPGRIPMRKRSVGEIRRLVDRAAGMTPSLQTPARAPELPAQAGNFTSTGHQMHEYLYLAAALGADLKPTAPRLTLEAAEIETTKAQLLGRVKRIQTTTTAVFLGMNPSAAYGPAKRWPAGYFAAAAREISARRNDVVWVAFGGAGDRDLCADITRQAKVPFLNLAGDTTLRELMGCLAACQVLLTNDSGPMHLAAALGTPVVVPFGSTSPELTGPGLPGDPRHRLLLSRPVCAPCFRRNCPIDSRCLTGVSAKQAVTAVLECLAAGSTA